MGTDYQPYHAIKEGTAGGVLLVVLIEIDAAALIQTAILASVGAVVSFTVSMVLRWLIKKVRRK